MFKDIIRPVFCSDLMRWWWFDSHGFLLYLTVYLFIRHLWASTIWWFFLYRRKPMIQSGDCSGPSRCYCYVHEGQREIGRRLGHLAIADRRTEIRRINCDRPRQKPPIRRLGPQNSGCFSHSLGCCNLMQRMSICCSPNRPCPGQLECRRQRATIWTRRTPNAFLADWILCSHWSLGRCASIWNKNKKKRWK